MAFASATFQRFVASLLGLLLVSCSATRSAGPGPSGPADLSKYVLLITEAPDGQVTHSWRPIKDFDPTEYQYRTSTSSVASRIQLVSRSLAEECYKKQIECENRCLRSSKVLHVDHYVFDDSVYGPWETGKREYCGYACMQQAAECNRTKGRKPQTFTELDRAIDWLKRHRTEILVGTVIVIMGVTFVAVTAATAGGALVLAPAMLLVSSDVLSEPSLAAAKP